MLNFHQAYTSRWTILESLKKHYPVVSANHLPYKRPLEVSADTFFFIYTLAKAESPSFNIYL